MRCHSTATLIAGKRRTIIRRNDKYAFLPAELLAKGGIECVFLLRQRRR